MGTPTKAIDHEEWERWVRRCEAAERAYENITNPRLRYQRMLTYSTNLTKAARDVGMALAWYTQGATLGGARPSRWNLAQDTATSLRTVDRGLKELEAAGWVSVAQPGGRGRGATVWDLHVPKVICEAPADLRERIANGNGTVVDDRPVTDWKPSEDQLRKMHERTLRDEGYPDWA